MTPIDEVVAELRARGYEVRQDAPGRYYVTGRTFTSFMGPEGLRAFLRAVERRSHAKVGGVTA